MKEPCCFKSIAKCVHILYLWLSLLHQMLAVFTLKPFINYKIFLMALSKLTMRLSLTFTFI